MGREGRRGSGFGLRRKMQGLGILVSISTWWHGTGIGAIDIRPPWEDGLEGRLTSGSAVYSGLLPSGKHSRNLTGWEVRCHFHQNNLTAINRDICFFVVCRYDISRGS